MASLLSLDPPFDLAGKVSGRLGGVGPVEAVVGRSDAWSRRTVFAAEDDLVFAHPQTGKALDGSKITRRFQEACRDVGVRVVRFHDLRHTFATRLAASGQPLRTIQEFPGHADSKTTQIYAHYAPSAREVEMVNDAFAPELPEASVASVRLHGWRASSLYD